MARHRSLIIKLASIVLLACAAINNAWAAPTDAKLDAHVTELAQQLRCLVCQNQTIADSTADLALDLKKQVREQLAQGRSDQQVIDFMVQRYGDFVLYRPPVKPLTWLLWFGPLGLLLTGLGLWVVRLRAQPASASDSILDASEEEQEGRQQGHAA